MLFTIKKNSYFPIIRIFARLYISANRFLTNDRGHIQYTALLALVMLPVDYIHSINISPVVYILEI